eukprot:1139726-Pelagomonas_calceolata.AAC.9
MVGHRMLVHRGWQTKQWWATECWCTEVGRRGSLMDGINLLTSKRVLVVCQNDQAGCTRKKQAGLTQDAGSRRVCLLAGCVRSN